MSLLRRTPFKPRSNYMPQQSRKRREYRSSEKGRADLAYLGRVRSLPCCICHEWGLTQTSPTQAHHPIHGRYGNRKVPDVMCIPLCEGHHQGLRDTTKVALHREPDLWRELFGTDTDWIGWTQLRLGMET